jgi:beta-catenin-like protein 1
MTRRSGCQVLFYSLRVLTAAVRFIDSEADLDGAIRALLPLAQVPVMAYPELVKSGSVARLVGLLGHENADIAIDVIEVIHELTDEDNEADEEEEGEEQRDAAVKALITGLVCSNPSNQVILCSITSA